MEKQVYKDDGGVLITTARIVLSDKVFATANVTSVSVRESVHMPPKGGAIVTAVVGGLIALAGLNGKISALIAGVIILGIGIVWYMGLKDVHRFHVFIGSASGESEGLSHGNRKSIEEVAQAINDAIAMRG